MGMCLHPKYDKCSIKKSVRIERLRRVCTKELHTILLLFSYQNLYLHGTLSKYFLYSVIFLAFDLQTTIATLYS